MKPCSYYSNVSVPYPDKTSFRTNYWYSAGRTIATQKGDGPIEYAAGVSHEDINAGIKESVWDYAALATARGAYAVASSKLREEFITDLFVELDIVEHPKRNALYSMAYERGHAHGFEEVAAEARALVSLIKD